MCLFRFWFPQSIFLGLGLLRHMVVLFLVFKGISILSSIVTILIHIPTAAHLFKKTNSLTILACMCQCLLSYQVQSLRVCTKQSPTEQARRRIRGDTESVSKAREEWGILKTESGPDGKTFLIVPLKLTIFIDPQHLKLSTTQSSAQFKINLFP